MTSPATPDSQNVALENFRDAMRAVRGHVLAPPPDMSLVEWAEKYRRLSTSAGAIGGKFRTSRVEVARGPMMAVTEKGVRKISAMTCTQLLKTTLIENVIGYFAHLDPCPMLFTREKEKAVKDFSKERLNPMVRATPALRNIFGDTRTRRSNDTLEYKEFPGGFLALESAGTPGNLASRAIRVTVADEIDKYEATKEGDPLKLLEERTSTYKFNSLNVRCCSPTMEETSRIGDSIKESDQRKPYVTCPHCKWEQHIRFFSHVEWEKSEDGAEHFPLTASLRCEMCKEEWSEAQRLAMMTTEGAIRWKQTRPFRCCKVHQDPAKTRNWRWDEKNQIDRAVCAECDELAVPNTHAGFMGVSKLYSPFITVPELARDWLAAKGNPETKQTFYNTQLGELFEIQAMRKVEGHSLLARRETYNAEVPLGACVLVAGVDVQGGGDDAHFARLECEVKAYGLGEESWSIAYEVFEGDPSKPDVWHELDKFLVRGFKYEGGGIMGIRAACIDSGGHATQEVYKFARARVARNIWAIKGASDRSGQWSPVWPAPRKKVEKKYKEGYKPVIIGVNAAKEAIRQRLIVTEPGPGFCHFPMERTEGYFDQLTSERLVIERKVGINIRRWDLPSGRRNEALDCNVYAYAALQGLYVVRKLNMEKLAEMLSAFQPQEGRDTPPAPAQAESPEEVSEAPPPKPLQNKPQRVHRSKFLS